MNAPGFFSVHIYSRQQGEREIDVLRIDLFHRERLQSRGVKPENSADEAVFIFFTFFDGV